MIVKDAMVMIHLAKLTLLEASCRHFKQVVIPEAVHDEVLAGKAKGYADATLMEELIAARKVHVQRVKNRQLLDRATEFNVQGGEAEALALYWQEHAEYLASDDDNLRKKSSLLDVNLIGTPAILLTLYKGKLISQAKCEQAVVVLRKIGWFSNAVLDHLMMEVS